ncbi:MAG TPA: calcium/sodium antiporter [Candidatus Aminicenantes bacterium]|nr:calcium/sodium antiporter [Candidatus Aminicenantes bacterium]
MIPIYFIVLILAFVLMFKSADFFIEGSVGLAQVFDLPKLVVGIVLVGLATTAPELAVSVQSAYLGHPEIALGNAIGSVIVDDGVALALAGLLAAGPIFVNCRLIRFVGAFLLGIDLAAFLLALNGTIGRLEGLIFLVLLVVYYIILIKNRDIGETFAAEEEKLLKDIKKVRSTRYQQLKKSSFYFGGGIIGVLLTSRLVIWSATNIARSFSISETVIGLTIIAIGTSLPEISTCIVAARKGEGEIAVGDIIGADILNILWIIGASALVNPIDVELKVIYFSFPAMLIIVTTMLLSLNIGCRLTKPRSALLLGLYVIYFFLVMKFFVF